MRKTVYIDVWLDQFAVQQKLTEQCESIIIKKYTHTHTHTHISTKKSQGADNFIGYSTKYLKRHDKLIKFRLISLINKTNYQNISKSNPTLRKKKLHTMTKRNIPGKQGWFNMQKSITAIIMYTDKTETQKPHNHH